MGKFAKFAGIGRGSRGCPPGGVPRGEAPAKSAQPTLLPINTNYVSSSLSAILFLFFDTSNACCLAKFALVFDFVNISVTIARSARTTCHAFMVLYLNCRSRNFVFNFRTLVTDLLTEPFIVLYSSARISVTIMLGCEHFVS